MKVHNEAAVEAQIQELRTITRLQGEPHTGDCHSATGQLAILLPTQAPTVGHRRTCHLKGP